MAQTSDWTFLLAQQFLDAAVSCDAVCDRRFVTDAPTVEAPPPGCPCQLVAQVSEGWERAAANDPCSLRPVVSVRLTLDLCVPVPGENEVPDPVAEATAARTNATTRWLMMLGMVRAAKTGALHGWTWDPEDPMPAGVGGCVDVRPAPWTATVREGGIARWESTWRIY